MLMQKNLPKTEMVLGNGHSTQMVKYKIYKTNKVADPRFSRRVPTPKVGAPTYHLANFLPENCMETKQIEQRETRPMDLLIAQLLP